MKVFNPTAGTSIQTACEDCVQMARDYNDTVSMSFNGRVVIATPKTKPSLLLDEWERIGNEQAEAYRQSPEYLAEKIEQRLIQNQSQNRVLELSSELPTALKEGLTGAVTWCRDFGEHSDLRGVHFDRNHLVALLEGAGYKDSDCIGLSKKCYLPGSDKGGRWIVGQCINQFKSRVGAIHPLMVRFAKEWLSEPETD